jgi:4-hydroxythreonine-4-phosphate dehydrogenase
LGDPAGIGPEIVVKAWAALRDTGPAFVVVGDHDSLAAAPSVRRTTVIRRVTSPREGARLFAEVLPVIDLPLTTPVVSGKSSPLHAQPVIRWIETAVGLALSGAVSGVVTAPIAKAPLYAAGFGFPGHTEFLAELTAGTAFDGPRGPVMMLAAGDLKTVLVTIHQPLKDAIASLSPEAIVRVGQVTAHALRRDFGVAAPRLTLAGLNPHAGENGTLGQSRRRAAASARHRLPGRPSGRQPVSRGRAHDLRRGDLPLPRPGPDPDQDHRLLGRGQRHARPADRAHVARPRRGIRHRRPRAGAARQPDRRPPHGRRDGGPARSLRR